MSDPSLGSRGTSSPRLRSPASSSRTTLDSSTTSALISYVSPSARISEPVQIEADSNSSSLFSPLPDSLRDQEARLLQGKPFQVRREEARGQVLLHPRRYLHQVSLVSFPFLRNHSTPRLPFLLFSPPPGSPSLLPDLSWEFDPTPEPS